MKYMSSCLNHCIIIFDLNLNKLKQFGSQSSGNNQFIYPYGLRCHGDYFYICDSISMRIQILTHDFEYVNTIRLDDLPIKVQISNTTIGISCNRAILFYDIDSKELKYKHSIVKTLINKLY